MAGIRAVVAQVVGRVRSTTRGRARRGRARRAVAGSGLARLTDRELVRAWEQSSRYLATDLEATRRLTLVITRQHLLDELRERHLDARATPPDE